MVDLEKARSEKVRRIVVTVIIQFCFHVNLLSME